MPARRLSVLVLAIITVASLGLAMTLRVVDQKSDGSSSGIMWSDEAAYHIMTHSLAFDGDLRYERADLDRVYAAGYGGGPSGMFLVRNPDDQNLYFAKAWVYSAVAAPLVWAFGDNGFFILHALLLGAMLAAGFAYARRGNGDGVASLYTITYVLGSVVTVYFFWMTPEWFNFATMFLATFLWLYKEGPPGAEPHQDGWLDGTWTDYAAAALYAVAIFSKPSNLLLIGPLLLWQLARGRIVRAMACGSLAGVVIVAMFGVTYASIGDWNYQGGDRKTFNVLTSYPYMSENHTFDSTGIAMTTPVEAFALIPPVDTLSRDLIYVWIGRNGGMLIYMFPAVLALLLFTAAPKRRWWSPHGLLALFWLLTLVAIVVAIRGNWIGGGGTIGGRYFVSVYPVLFFLIPAATRPLGAAVSWILWGGFLAPTVLTPFAASIHPAAHTQTAPFVAFPAELTILQNLPFNTNARARRVPLTEPTPFWVYFLDDGTYLREADLGGFWVKGADEAEFVLRTTAPIEFITLQLSNRGTSNTVVVRHGSTVKRIPIDPGKQTIVSFPANESQRYIEGPTWLYRISVSSSASTVPSSDSPASDDHRELGVFVRPSVAPVPPAS